jgi:hypothetical protein
MSADWKKDGQDYAKYLRLLPKKVVEDNNKRGRACAEKEAQEFTEAFKAGKCSVCKSDLSSYVKEKPCLHWLLKPDGFEKSDLLRVTNEFSMGQVELYMRRAANQEAFAKNINDMADEGTGKLVEPTAKYKNLEWAISCGQGDYDGHETDSEDSKHPHYHFQMRIDGKRYIDYNDFHIPLHRRDILTMEAVKAAPEYVTRRFAGGTGMGDVFKDDAVEKLAISGSAVENEADGLVKLDHFVVADKGKPMRAEEVQAAVRRARGQGKPATAFLREIPNVRVHTLATPGPGVVEQAVRGGRGQKPPK